LNQRNLPRSPCLHSQLLRRARSGALSFPPSESSLRWLWHNCCVGAASLSFAPIPRSVS